MAYLVERVSAAGVEQGFCKALDFASVRDIAKNNSIPIVDALQLLTAAYTFERDLVLDCAGIRMRNIVRGIAAGEYFVDDPTVDALLSSVPYIIFERADGDVRSQLATGDFDDSWRLRVLHGASNGLRQLHQSGIFHQDLKPSNVMTVGRMSKLGDLGRASRLDRAGAWDGPTIAGDRTYAPPELLYGEYHLDDRVRRLATDLYHIGSLAFFLFGGSGLTALLLADLGPTFHWRTWPRDYRNVLPYMRGAFDRALVALEPSLPAGIRMDLSQLIRELADPDPLLRGRAGIGTGRYSMERYVSVLDRIARRCEIALRLPTRS